MHYQKIKDQGVELANLNKVSAYNGKDYPISDMDDRMFEVLIYQIFKKRIDSKDKELAKKFDNAFLMQGVGEKGRDIILVSNESIIGIVQCKRYSSNLQKKEFIIELIKLCIHQLLDNKLFDPIKLNYYLATTNGFAGNLVDLIASYKKNLLKETKLREWTNLVIKSYSAFEGIKYEVIEKALINSLKSINIILIYPEQINRWLIKYIDIAKVHFEIRTVVDNSIITDLIKSITESERENIATFTTTYREAAIENLSKLNFFGIDLKNFDKPTEDIELSELYVRPNFRMRNSEKMIGTDFLNKAKEKILNVSELFEKDKNFVLLGDPGAGKSLFVEYIISTLLKQSDKEFKNYFDFIPFRIELRKYVNHKGEKTFIEFLQNILNIEYETVVSLKTLKTIIDQKNTLFFFDGLDEIFEFSKKYEIKKSIELFAKMHVNAKCIVTSRFIGYHDLRFDSDRFHEFEILDLSEKQINELIHNFFTTQIGNLKKRDDLISSCVKQIEDVEDELKSNPLILTLMILLVKNNVSIPDSKLQIYECCTDTLLNRDELKHRTDIGKLKEKEKKNQKRILCSLAFWQYTIISKGDLVTREKSKKQIAEYLLEKKEYTDIDGALLAADEFLEYSEKRSIYFDNNFTHKTFLEYYAADFIYKKYIVRNKENEKNELIAKFISFPFWYVVFELLFARVDKNVEDEDVLDSIISYQIKHVNTPELYFFLLNNFRKLRFISSHIKLKVLKKSLTLCIGGNDIVNKVNSFSKDDTIFNSLANYIITEDGLSIFRLAFLELEGNALEDEELTRLYKAYYELKVFYLRNPGNNDFAVEINKKKKLEELATLDELLFSHCNIAYQNEVDFNNLFQVQINCFGIESIFMKHQFEYTKEITRLSSFEIFLSRNFGKISYNSLANQLLGLMEIGISEMQLLSFVEHIRMYSLSNSSTFNALINYYKMSTLKFTDNFLEIIIKNHKVITKVDISKIKDDFKDPLKFRKLERILKSSD